jgi:hypothetical protein
MADAELEAAHKTLDQYRQDGVAFHTSVEHQLWITSATTTEATIVDRYSGQSMKVDLDTGQPQGSEPVSETFADAFFMRNIDGAWKVVGEQAWD